MIIVGHQENLIYPQVGNSQNPDWDFTANLNFNGDSRQHLVVEVMEPAHILNGT